MRALSPLVAPFLVLLLAAGALAQPADGEWVDALVMARDRLDADIQLLDGELASIDERTASDDWVVTLDPRAGHENEPVELDLRIVDDYVPLAQLVDSQPGELKQALLEGLRAPSPVAFEAVSMIIEMDVVAGRASADIEAQLRRYYGRSTEAKRGLYAAWRAKVQAERNELAALRDEIQQELDALEQAAVASASPSSSLEPALDRCVADDENAIDVLSCDWDATPEPEAPWEPSIPPTELEELPSAAPSPVLTPQSNPDPSPGSSQGPSTETLEPVGVVCPGALAAALEAPYTTLTAGQIGSCFDDCQDWISWHASFGDTLPEGCTTAAPDVAELPEAVTDAEWCWDDYGQWQLWGESQDQPLCAGVESE